MSNNEKRVPPELKSLALDALVRQLFEQSWGKARSWIETGKIFVNDVRASDPRSFPGEGARITLNMNAPKSGGSAGFRLSRDQVIFADTQLIVVNKPSGISSVPYERGERGTLEDAVRDYLKQGHVEVVHRLDKETSGLLVFARTQSAAKHLANQFRFHTVHRRYVALAHGRLQAQMIRTTLIENRGDGLRGSAPPNWRVAAGEGQEATTHVRVLKHYEAMTFVECQLETGRTHQIRIHLSEAEHPLLGEKLYIRDYREPLLPAPRVMLHAAELGFTHPVTGAEMRWKQETPADFSAMLAGLR
jgi:23S rRNA pseudouridine1911/1915/1917 synthase